MVDEPKIRPQVFSKRGGGINVPGFGDIPSLRNVTAVRDTGTESMANAYASMAQDSLRLQQLSGEQFDREMKQIKTLQALEADKVFSDILIRSQAAIEEIRNTTEYSEDIPGETLRVFRETRNDTLAESRLSAYQKQYLQEKLGRAETETALQSLDYQARLRDAEAEYSIEEIKNTRSLLASKNPSLLPSLLDEADELMDQYGTSMNEVERQEATRAYKESLIQNTVLSQAETDPESALNVINSELAEKSMSFEALVNTKSKVEAAIDAKIRDDEKRADELRKQTENDTLLAVIDDVYDVGENPNITVSSIAEMARNGDISSAHADKLIDLKRSVGTKAGNPRLAAEISAKIITRRQNGEAPIEASELLQDMLPVDGVPLNSSEMKQIMDLSQDQSDPAVDAYRDRIKKDYEAYGEAGYKAMALVNQKINDYVKEAQEKGIEPAQYFTPGTSYYVGDALMDNHRPSLEDQMNALTRELQSLERKEQPPVDVESTRKPDPLAGLTDQQKQSVKDTAKKYGLSEEEIVKQLRASKEIK